MFFLSVQQEVCHVCQNMFIGVLHIAADDNSCLGRAGGHLWSQRFGDPEYEAGEGVAVDGRGNIVLTGQYGDTVDFGGGTLTSAGQSDIFLAKFWAAQPVIHAVRDVPGDQGGMVNVAWDASGADTPEEHVITHYTVWRAIKSSTVSSVVLKEAQAVEETWDSNAPESWEALPRIQRLGAFTYYWYLMTSVDAYYLTGYSAPVSTLFDSTAVSNEYHYFQVIAHTSDPYTFYISDPDSGYSVDNLAPCCPQGLAGEQSSIHGGILLTWIGNTEPDFDCYRVYCGISEDFVPAPGNLIGSSRETFLLDSSWRWDSGFVYKVSAVDINGNESEYARLLTGEVTATATAPSGTFLQQNQPNPFNPVTTITFGLEFTEGISLKVYDVSGRLVRTLVDGISEAGPHTVAWDGRDEEGRSMASGVYFYRLRAQGFDMTKKMVLMK